MKFTSDQVKKVLLEKRVMLRKKLMEVIGCSPNMIYLLLKQCGGINSLNMNAKYCTLREIAEFDEHGLWGYEDVRFSKYGSLPNTIVGIVSMSSAGMPRKEIGDILGPAALPALTSLANKGLIGRERVGKSFVYFSPQENEMAVQLEACRRVALKDGIGLPKESVIISMLVGLIVNPGISQQGLAEYLEEQGVVVSRQEIAAIFEHYDLKKKGD